MGLPNLTKHAELKKLHEGLEQHHPDWKESGIASQPIAFMDRHEAHFIGADAVNVLAALKKAAADHEKRIDEDMSAQERKAIRVGKGLDLQKSPYQGKEHLKISRRDEWHDVVYALEHFAGIKVSVTE